MVAINLVLRKRRAVLPGAAVSPDDNNVTQGSRLERRIRENGAIPEEKGESAEAVSEAGARDTQAILALEIRAVGRAQDVGPIAIEELIFHPVERRTAVGTPIEVAIHLLADPNHHDLAGASVDLDGEAPRAGIFQICELAQRSLAAHPST
jgi:hypothetical protein